MPLKRRTHWVYISAYGLYYRIWDGHLQTVEDDGFGSINAMDAVDVTAVQHDVHDWEGFTGAIAYWTNWRYGVDYIIRWEGGESNPLPVYGSDDMLIIP